MSTGNMTKTTVLPNPDSLEEVRTLQNNYTPKYSIMGASVVMLQTKSGTQQFHGTLFEYVRNNDFDSRNFFSPTAPIQKQNIFGGTLGGPVYLPGMLKNRNRTFFFFSEQITIQHRGQVNRAASPILEELECRSMKTVRAGFGGRDQTAPLASSYSAE